MLGAFLSRGRFYGLCAWWLAVSFGITVLLGWGTAYNQLFIYALYFGWAYVGLLHGLLSRLFRGRPRAAAAVCAALSMAMLVMDAAGISGILRAISAGP